jgi:hypothetical protein
MPLKTIVIYAAFLMAFFFVQSCGPSVTFEEPQPSGVGALEKFPAKIQGNYIGTDGVTIIHISDVNVIKIVDLDLKIPKDSIKANDYTLSNDTLTNNTTGKKQKVIITNDSVSIHQNWADTIFSLSDKNVLKKFKGYYFLNTRFDSNAWTVKKICLKHGILCLSEIGSDDDIKTLQEFAEPTNDTSSYHFKMNKKQFKDFLKQNTLEVIDSFKKIN